MAIGPYAAEQAVAVRQAELAAEEDGKPGVSRAIMEAVDESIRETSGLEATLDRMLIQFYNGEDAIRMPVPNVEDFNKITHKEGALRKTYQAQGWLDFNVTGVPIWDKPSPWRIIIAQIVLAVLFAFISATFVVFVAPMLGWNLGWIYVIGAAIFGAILGIFRDRLPFIRRLNLPPIKPVGVENAVVFVKNRPLVSRSKRRRNKAARGRG